MNYRPFVKMNLKLILLVVLVNFQLIDSILFGSIAETKREPKNLRPPFPIGSIVTASQIAHYQYYGQVPQQQNYNDYGTCRSDADCSKSPFGNVCDIVRGRCYNWIPPDSILRFRPSNWGNGRPCSNPGSTYECGHDKVCYSKGYCGPLVRGFFGSSAKPCYNPGSTEGCGYDKVCYSNGHCGPLVREYGNWG